MEVFANSRGVFYSKIVLGLFCFLSISFCISNLACSSLNLYFFLDSTKKCRTSSGDVGNAGFN